MKNCKKILALLLALAMVFAFAACDKDSGTSTDDDTAGTKTESITGEWSVEIDIYDLYYAALVENSGVELDMNSSLVISATYKFDDNGEFELTYSNDKNDLLDIKAEYTDAVLEFSYAYAESEGMSKDDFKEAYKSETGTDFEDDIEAECVAEIDNFVETLCEISVEGYYKFEDGKIYLAEDEDDLADLDDADAVLTVTVTSSKLTITEIEGEYDELAAMMPDYDSSKLPWKLEKQ